MRLFQYFLPRNYSVFPRKYLQCNFSSINYSDSSSIKKKVCIVGSGPAGFYAAQYILKNLQNCQIDIIERLPVPFGLVRFGVAPDHPEVKNVINTFTKTAEHSNVRFLGNLSLGIDFTLKELRERYHTVLLTYGAEEDQKLNIPNEDNENVISARKFVAWYNGLPGAENLNPKLSSSERITLIGQGNVAIDVARILLSSVDELKKTDITEYALENLSRSKVKEVYLVGRRGPLQAAFTIKELREMLKLPKVSTIWRKEDFKGITEILPNLMRPRKRLTELMINNLETKIESDNKKFFPIFFRSPKCISEKKIEFTINTLDKDIAIPSNDTETIHTDMVLRSIGYKSICVDKNINFNESAGYINNKMGRVMKKGTQNDEYEYGLYVSGWLATGPTGVILTTMNGAFSVGKIICDDINSNKVPCDENKPGLDISNRRVVTWQHWENINKTEVEAGKKVGKPREKIINIEEMLKAAGV